jgi:hypothetical protein
VGAHQLPGRPRYPRRRQYVPRRTVPRKDVMWVGCCEALTMLPMMRCSGPAVHIAF